VKKTQDGSFSLEQIDVVFGKSLHDNTPNLD